MLSVAVNESFRLNCTPEMPGSSAFELAVHWFYNGLQLSAAQSATFPAATKPSCTEYAFTEPSIRAGQWLQTAGGNYTLVNQHATVSDSGVYQCALFPPRADGVLGVSVAFRQFLVAVTPRVRKRGESEVGFFEWHRMDALELSLAIGALLLLIGLLVTAALWIFYLLTKRTAEQRMRCSNLQYDETLPISDCTS